MKKLLLVLFLITIITSPILAQKTENLSFDVKAGLGFNSNILLNDWYITGINTTENFYIRELNNFFSLETEFYYYIFKNLSLGIGINHFFDSKVNEMIYNFTNIFLAIKPEAYLNSEIFSSVYGVCKIGYGIINTSGTFYEEKLDIDNGLYLGLGIGTTIKSFIIECIYSINYNKINNSGFFDFSDLKYTTFILNIGYKFNIINN
jgi:hypothetical protein